MKRLTRTRPRRIATVTATILTLVVASAAAYYLVFANGAGSGSSKLGTATTAEKLTLSASFAEGLKPGSTEPITFTVKNTTTTAGEVTHLTPAFAIDPTHAVAGCKAEWFKTEGEGIGSGPPNNETNGEWVGMPSALTPVMIAAGEEKTLTNGGVTLRFIESGTNQTACSGATLTVNLTSTPN